MKVITTGDRAKGKWWIGRTATCAGCGQVIEFEAHDNERGDWQPMTTPDVVAMRCDNCGVLIELSRPG